MKLEDIKEDLALVGVVPDQIVKVVSVKYAGEDAIKLYFELQDGMPKSQMVYRYDEAKIFVAEIGRPWAFDAPGAEFKLAAEAYRIDLAYLFDPMMAVHSSNVEPLPHQITAVYESMLPRQPLRFILADDPGAGKTIMAGLLIRELLMRADAQRILIIAPGSLVEQWQDELVEKFSLNFKIFSRDMVEQSQAGNPFDEFDLLIGRIDQISRSPDLMAKLKSTRWDLIVVDEAHKCSASYSGDKVTKTKRFELAQLLGSITRHFLLMTATPHSGKEANFQLFLSLIDEDRFYGKFRQGAKKVEVSDIMRRMVKEQLLKFDGTPLFPERRASTVNYTLSTLEQELYEAVTDYVREEMNRADRLKDGKRKGTVGFAMTSLQRRLASSPEAIFQSLKRRHQKLKARVDEEKKLAHGSILAETLSPDLDSIDDAQDDLPADLYEELEQEIVDQATAAQTIQELEAEICILSNLEKQARTVVHSSQDRKWDELSKLLQNTPEMRDADGLQRKLIIFTEHRDTLNYLVAKIRGLVGSEAAVVIIHGGVKREDRRLVQESFRHDPSVRVLVATDAAGEGVNLQNAHLMVNYDLPWNPNRIEQRFGRIHRIGQTEVCHLWNLVAAETREGQVFQKLFEKLEIVRAALGGQVFDILGEVFVDTPLKELLVRAIRYGEDPEVRAQLLKVVEGVLDTAHLSKVIEDNALCMEVMDAQRLYKVKEEMERAEARKLQPFFVRVFFQQAFSEFGGELRQREQERWEIPNVPGAVREHHRQQVSAKAPKKPNGALLKKYERVCFDKQCVRISRPGAPMAALLHPGHPLMQAVTSLVLERHLGKLKQGALFLDPNDPGIEPHVLFIIDHSLNDGTSSTRPISRRLQFVTLDKQARAVNAGWAPHLDLEPLGGDDHALVQDILNASWITHDLEQKALYHAASALVPEHLSEVRARREREVQKILAAVHDRLIREINHWQDREIQFQTDVKAGKQTAEANLKMAQRTLDTLQSRLAARTKELEMMQHVTSASPVIVGGALVIPSGLLSQRKGQHVDWSADAEARARIERVAMLAVMESERALGHEVLDVSAQKCGWDITSVSKNTEGQLQQSRHIEVKGRVKGADTITVTRNEILYALNQADKFILAVVLVDGDAYEGPYYIKNPFTQEPDWAVTSINMDLKKLLARASKPQA